MFQHNWRYVVWTQGLGALGLLDGLQGMLRGYEHVRVGGLLPGVSQESPKFLGGFGG